MCLTLIPSSTQGIRSELNSRNPTIFPLKHLQKALQITPADPNNQDSQQPNHLAGDTYRQVQSASRPPGRGHVPQGTKRLKKIPMLQIPPGGLPLLPGTRVSGVTVVADIAWRKLSAVRCLKSNHPTGSTLSPSGSHITAWHHDSVCENSGFYYSPSTFAYITFI